MGDILIIQNVIFMVTFEMIGVTGMTFNPSLYDLGTRWGVMVPCRIVQILGAECVYNFLKW